MKRVFADLAGGIVAAMVLLPQAIGLGAAFWGHALGAAAAGAVSALFTGACLSFGSALMRGTRGLVSAPTGPTFVLLVAAVDAYREAGLEAQAMAQAVAATVAIAGLGQLLIGALRLGQWIKFIPHPVVSGFMTGAGILMVSTQWDAAAAGWPPMLAFAAAVAGVFACQRWLPRWPAPLVGSLSGIAAFFIAALWGGVRPEWLIGGGKPVQAALTVPGWEGWEALPWRLVGLYGAALAVLASLDTLLTALVADVVTASRHDPRRELLGQGAGHLASAALGGMAGAGTTGATLVAIRAGGAGTPGWAAGAAMALVGWALLPWVVMLPTAALAGVIAAVGLSLIDRDIWLWWRMPGTRRDALIALLVAALAVGTDLMVAVAAGVALAVIEFVRLQAGDPVVLRRWTRAERPSPRRRPRKEREKLAEVGERIVGYDLRGVLFFGTVEHLREALARDLEAAEVVILDMRRVLRVDLTALRVLEQMAGKMRARGARLLISHAPPNLGEVRRELHGPDRFEPYYPGEHLEIFAETNEALEAAEDWWLEKQGITPRRGGIVAPEEAELLRELAPEVRAKVLAKMRRVKRAEGEFLFRAGEPGEELFVVLEGEVEVWLRLPEGDYMRLAVYGPGATFGELSFLEPGPRAADAVVAQDFVGLALLRRDWDALAQENPQAALVLLVRLAHDLAEDLRRADATIQRLAR